MKKQHVTIDGQTELSHEELKNVSGGGSFVMGVTIFGFARLCGMMAGYLGL